MSEQVFNIIISIAPSVITIFSIIGVIIKVLKEFAALKKQVVDMKSMTEVKEQINKVLNENYELKKKLNETLTKLDHVDRSNLQ